MTTSRKLVIWLGAPMVVLVGLVGLWGARNAAAVKRQIVEWADSLEQSANPVAMHLGFIPMYVDGKKVGTLSTVVVQRDRPGAVDSVRLVVEPLEGQALAGWLEGCRFRLDPQALEQHGPFGLKRAVRCISDTTGLAPFGTVVLAGAGREVGLFMWPEQLPCTRTNAGEACTNLGDHVHDLRDRIRDEVRIHLRSNAQTIRSEVRRSVR